MKVQNKYWDMNFMSWTQLYIKHFHFYPYWRSYKKLSREWEQILWTGRLAGRFQTVWKNSCSGRFKCKGIVGFWVTASVNNNGKRLVKLCEEDERACIWKLNLRRYSINIKGLVRVEKYRVKTDEVFQGDIHRLLKRYMQCDYDLRK